MPYFNLTANVTISMYTTVEAETLEQAIEIAKERDLMSIAHDGYDKQEETWMADEIDGQPENIHVE